jgi:hypothetical protein
MKNIYYMNIIFRNIIKKKVIQNIKRIGGDLSEIVLDLQLSEIFISTIELNEIDDSLIIHVFLDDLDQYYDFDDLPEEDRILILTTLSFY